MTAPERSAALAKALSLDAGLPEDFASQVAALADAADRRHFSWNDVALPGAFVAMIGMCMAGWFWLEPQAWGGVAWLEPIIRAAASAPWVAFGIAGIGLVQLLSFQRRIST